jgi:hypothetical protein
MLVVEERDLSTMVKIMSSQTPRHRWTTAVLAASASASGRAAKAAASAFDQSPISPAVLSERLINRFYDKRTARAAFDPTWTDIESRRKVDGSQSKVFLSDDLTLADAEKQRRIEAEITPEPWWLPVAFAVRRFSLRSPVNRTIHAGQRLLRGWDDRSTYDLGSHLCAQLAEQLEHLADTAHGWPSDDTYPTFEDWTSTLRLKAAALRRFDGSPESEAALSAWYELVSDNTSDPEAVNVANETHQKIEAADREAAKQAMRWVAENLDILWD